MVQYRLSAFDKVVKSRPESVPAVYESTSHCLWATRQDGSLQWAPVARELAIALCPEEDPGLFAAGLKEVLAAETITEAATVLDELGFSRLDTTVIEPPASSKAAESLGVAEPVGDNGLPIYQEVDQPLAEKEQQEEPEPLTAEDALRALGITQDPTSPISSPSEPTTISNSAGGTAVSGQYHGGQGAGRPGGVGPTYNTSGSGKAQHETIRAATTGAERKFVSYVSLSHTDEEEPDPDGLTQQERMNLEERAIERILDEEPELKRTPPNNPGFDLTEVDPNGRPVRWIEVKAMKATLNDRPVGISRTQFEWAQKHGSGFWLYIVENAGTPEQARVVRIQDPAGKSQTFTFDHGWLSVAEGIESTG